MSVELRVVRLGVAALGAAALGLAMASSSGRAQVYGFPSEVGVVDDGYGTLPPEPRLLPRPDGLPPIEPGLPPMGPVMAFPTAMPQVPPCPLVIEIGGGLRHAAHPRVTYGRPGCS